MSARLRRQVTSLLDPPAPGSAGERESVRARERGRESERERKGGREREREREIERERETRIPMTPRTRPAGASAGKGLRVWGFRCRANLEHIRQTDRQTDSPSRPDSGHGFQVFNF